MSVRQEILDRGKAKDLTGSQPVEYAGDTVAIGYDRVIGQEAAVSAMLKRQEKSIG
ncbi:MAG: hypothetical protein LBR70_01450 [Lactobacillaceae bacterium]|nr:hypothetical protein [Lactobacillaceae bacterium]